VQATFGGTLLIGSLRMVGVVIAYALSIFAVIWIVPVITTIPGLLAMFGVYLFAMGYGMHGSPRVATPALQIMIVLDFALLQFNGPNISLLPVMNFCLAVSMGVFVTFMVYRLWWRVSSADELKPCLADMMESVAGLMRSAVAAEDANFCLHWGFDMAEIRRAVAQGGTRGASTLSQQVVKNVFLWHGRSWGRKALEAMITPVMELVWTKRRILVVYLNVAEFGEGVFGVEAAAQHHFGVSAADLTAAQAARLAAVLPDPKGRDAGKPSRSVRNRAASVADGAETIRVDGRAGCFEPALVD
jgi:monofunctional biosynthetic peptidoglycan transglycosylase